MDPDLRRGGSSRIGFMSDDDERTPHVAVRLENTGDRLLLTVPWDRRLSDTYLRWFANASWGDDPERTRFAYEVPQHLEFNDAFGAVTLVNCQSLGMYNQITSNLGEGYVEPEYAILGGRGGADYTKINGLRSELHGLGDWMGLRSVTRDDRIADAMFVGTSLDVTSPPPVRIGRPMNLKVAPSFSIDDQSEPDTTRIRERMLIETLVSHPRDWGEHWNLHHAMRDLISVAGWQEAAYISHEVSRDADPVRTLDQTPRFRKWAPVATYETRIPSDPPRTRSNYLFTFQELKARGVSRWISLREDFARGIDPVLTSLFVPGLSLEARVAELGIGFEALGYRLALDDHMSQARAGRQSHLARLTRVGEDLQFQVPFSLQDWAAEATGAYNAVKHANREPFDLTRLKNSYRESILVFRLWVASRIGATSTEGFERTQ